jgi:hypothetical protein
MVVWGSITTIREVITDTIQTPQQRKTTFFLLILL